MAKILVSDSISESALNLLKNPGIEYSYEPDITAADLLNNIGNYEGLVVRSRTKVTKEVIERGKKLIVIGRAGVGLDNIDVATAKERGVQVVNTPDALTNAVAEFTLALMLNLSRSIPKADSSLKQGKWIKNSLMGQELKGKTYGTIGTGRIGAKVAELAHAFGMTIMANDVIPIPTTLIENLNIKVSSADEIFEQSDFVDLHVPLTKETTYLVNYDKMSRMKPTAFLINTSRGKVVNENDLLRALNEGKISGAALDVFETEPLTQSALQSSDKVILTPHIAGQTEEAQNEAGRLVVEQVIRSLS
jgi:D-3-phosphoglycerate dehydrogenase / 2-oxoglutarate reductase